jgi:cytochrome P450
VEKLRAELQPLSGTNGEFSGRDLQSADHLNGVINEALRLHPAVPSGLLRLTPPEGITVGETFIPGECTVGAPGYTLGRLESCYENPEEFMPERWYSRPEMVKNKEAFAPFTIGES